MPKVSLVRRIPFFYGYLMIVISVAAMLATSPGQTYGISVFNPSLREALGLSHTLLAGAYMFATLLASLPLSLVGAAMDRFGMRRTMAAVVFLFGVACFFTSQVRGAVTLFFAFLLLRMLGQGALGLLAGNVLPLWFDRRLGRVSGVSSVTTSLLISFIPGLFLTLIQAVDWRWAYVLLGFALWTVMFPLIACLLRNRPEEIGQFVDGSAADLKGEQQGIEREEGHQASNSLGLREASRTSSFWILIGMGAIWSMVATALAFHLLPLFESVGLGEEDAVRAFRTLLLGSACMQLIGGFLADRIRLNLLLSSAFISMGVGLSILSKTQSPGMAQAYALAFGLGQGLMSVSAATVWVRYYGREHLGKIRGAQVTAMVIGSSVGPFLMGLIFDGTGSFMPAINLFVYLAVGLVIALLFAHPPIRDTAAST